MTYNILSPSGSARLSLRALSLWVALFSLGFSFGCSRSHFYQIGEKGTISREYYDTCMGFIDLGKQLVGSIRSQQLAGSEDVCGCQAQLIYQHGIYVAQEPQTNEFKQCAQGLLAHTAPAATSIGSPSEITPTSRPLPLLPILLGVGFLGGCGILILLLKSSDED